MPGPGVFALFAATAGVLTQAASNTPAGTPVDSSTQRSCAKDEGLVGTRDVSRLVLNSFDAPPPGNWSAPHYGGNDSKSSLTLEYSTDDAVHGTASLRIEYKVVHEYDWGGLAGVTYLLPNSGEYNLVACKQLSLWYKVEETQSLHGLGQLRLILFDDSSCGNDCKVETMEHYYGFLPILDSHNRSGWQQAKLNLAGGEVAQEGEFALTRWGGVPGNARLDASNIRGFALEFDISKHAPLGASTSGTILLDGLECAGSRVLESPFWSQQNGALSMLPLKIPSTAGPQLFRHSPPFGTYYNLSQATHLVLEISASDNPSAFSDDSVNVTLMARLWNASFRQMERNRWVASLPSNISCLTKVSNFVLQVDNRGAALRIDRVWAVRRATGSDGPSVMWEEQVILNLWQEPGAQPKPLVPSEDDCASLCSEDPTGTCLFFAFRRPLSSNNCMLARQVSSRNVLPGGADLELGLAGYAGGWINDPSRRQTACSNQGFSGSCTCHNFSLGVEVDCRRFPGPMLPYIPPAWSTHSQVPVTLRLPEATTLLTRQMLGHLPSLEVLQLGRNTSFVEPCILRSLQVDLADNVDRSGNLADNVVRSTRDAFSHVCCQGEETPVVTKSGSFLACTIPAKVVGSDCEFRASNTIFNREDVSNQTVATILWSGNAFVCCDSCSNTEGCTGWIVDHRSVTHTCYLLTDLPDAEVSTSEQVLQSQITSHSGAQTVGWTATARAKRGEVALSIAPSVVELQDAGETLRGSYTLTLKGAIKRGSVWVTPKSDVATMVFSPAKLALSSAGPDMEQDATFDVNVSLPKTALHNHGQLEDGQRHFRFHVEHQVEACDSAWAQLPPHKIQIQFVQVATSCSLFMVAEADQCRFEWERVYLVAFALSLAGGIALLGAAPWSKAAIKDLRRQGSTVTLETCAPHRLWRCRGRWHSVRLVGAGRADGYYKARVLGDDLLELRSTSGAELFSSADSSDLVGASSSRVLPLSSDPSTSTGSEERHSRDLPVPRRVVCADASWGEVRWPLLLQLLATASPAGLPPGILGAPMLTAAAMFAWEALKVYEWDQETDKKVIGGFAGAGLCMGLAGALLGSFHRPRRALQRDVERHRSQLRRLHERDGAWPHPRPRGGQRGVRVGDLLDFFAAFEASIRDRNMHYVVQNLVKPLTAPEQLSFSELTAETQATWFVSHCWDTRFRELRDALEDHARQHFERKPASLASEAEKGMLRGSEELAELAELGELGGFGGFGEFGALDDPAVAVGCRTTRRAQMRQTAYWICSLSIRQWGAVAQEELGNGNPEHSSFYQAMHGSSCRGAVMVLDSAVTPLQRSWCLFELAQILNIQKQAKRTFTFCLGSASGTLNEGVSDVNFAMAIGRRLVNLDLRHAQASSRDDKDMIDTYVMDHGGFDECNSLIRMFMSDVLQTTKTVANAAFEELLDDLARPPVKPEAIPLGRDGSGTVA